MRVIKKFFLLVFGILGASFGLIFLALINWIFQIGWPFSDVCLYGLTGGMIAGWAVAWVGFIFITNWIRKKTSRGISRMFTRV